MQFQLRRDIFQNLTDKLRSHRNHPGAALITKLLFLWQFNRLLIHDLQAFKQFLPQCTRLPLSFLFSCFFFRFGFIGEFFFCLPISFQLDFIKKIQLTFRLHHMLLAGTTEEAFGHDLNLFFCQTFTFLTFGQGFPELFNRGLEAFNRDPQSFNGIQKFPLKHGIC